MYDGVTPICIRGVGRELTCFFWGGERQSMGEGFQPHDNSNNYVYHTFYLSAMHDTNDSNMTVNYLVLVSPRVQDILFTMPHFCMFYYAIDRLF